MSFWSVKDYSIEDALRDTPRYGGKVFADDDCVMKEIRHSTGDALQQFLSEDEKAAFSDAYVLNEETDRYELQKITKEAHSNLNQMLEQPFVMLYAAGHMEELMSENGMDAAQMAAMSADPANMEQMPIVGTTQKPSFRF